MAEEDNLALSVVCERSPGTAAEAASGRPPKAGSERARRQTMSRLYAELGALLPNLPPRASTTRIVEEAIACVGELRAKTAELEAYSAVAVAAAAAAGRAARDGAAEVVASGETSCFAVRLRAARARPGALTRVLEVFQRHGVAVLAATVARDGEETAVTVTTAAVAPRVLETIKAEIICAV
uniref:BHLH domain-containing protein n=1 Tax=Oryza meridionalis TaxID=40149 RepID=A0A0E0C2Y8_9ORYZ